MAKRIAIFISVRETRLNYSNRATSGVDNMSNNLRYALSNAFSNVRVIQNRVSKGRIVHAIKEASYHLEPGGFCLIYFHGHGNSIRRNPKYDINKDEGHDEALVCYDGLLFDDEIDQLLRGFNPRCKILTIMDCCSSKTVVEWEYNPKLYPKIIHIAAASDDGYNKDAKAGPSGGIMTQQIVNMLSGWGYSNYTYAGFLRSLRNRMRRINRPVYIRGNGKFSIRDMRTKLFK